MSLQQAFCSECDFDAIRSTAESAEQAVRQHMAEAHGITTKVQEVIGMTRVACPFCEFDIAVDHNNQGHLSAATQKVIDHVNVKHPENRSVYSPRPGVVEALTPAPETTKVTRSISLTTFPKSQEESQAAYNRLSHFAADLVTDGHDFSLSHNHFEGSETDLPDPYEDLYYDENTMYKVRETIARIYGNDTAMGVITELQNAGILFRERA